MAENLTELIKVEAASVSLAQNAPQNDFNGVNLANYEKDYAQARSTPVLVEMGENEIYNKCLQIICKLFRDLNKDFASTSAKREIDSLTQVLRDLLMTSPQYAGITIGDLELCFVKGAREDYGQNYGINVAAFNRWLKAYESDEHRISAIKKIRQHKQVTEGFKAKELTNEEIINSIIQDYNTLQSGADIHTFTLFYHWMWLNYDGFKPDSKKAYETIEELKPRHIAHLKAELISKYANKDKVRREIEDLNNNVFSEDFLNLCKIEYYKDFLRNALPNFEDKISKMVSK
jgi:hypothetical protein